jgi:hypothetical protein
MGRIQSGKTPNQLGDFMSTYTLSSTAPAAITLASTGAYKSPFTITSTGAINAPGALESYGALTGVVLATVTNAGHVTSNRYGIYLRDGGLLTNTGSIYGGSNGVKGEHITAIYGTDKFLYNANTTTLVNSGYVGASGYAVLFNYGGVVSNTNTGTIDSRSSTGIEMNNVAGTVLNAGTVLGFIGVQLQNGGYVSNASTGVLATTSQSYASGIVLNGNASTVVNAGHIEAATTGIYIQGSVLGAAIRNTGLIEGTTLAGSAQYYGGTGGIYDYQKSGSLSIYNSGTIASAQGASGKAIDFSTHTYYVSAGVYQNRSAILDLTIAPGAVFIGAVDAATSLTNHIELTSGSSAGVLSSIGSQFTGFATIAIDAGASWTLGGDSSGLLNGIQIDRVTRLDTIDLTGTLATSDTYDAGTGVLTLFGADGEIGELHLAVADEVPGTTFAVTSDGHGGTDITTNAICYLRGTRLATAQGERLVEDIAVGDLVVTRNGGLQPVRWVGRQSFAHRHQHGRQHERRNLPVRVRAGALGAGLPVRDLLVSPGHSMLVGGVLILARHLVNGVTVTQDTAPAGDIDYFQFELAAHDCIMAEGSWSESFADGPGLRGQFDNADEFFAQHPGYVEPPEVLLCAPRPLEGEALEAALRPVVALAGVGIAAGPLEGWIDAITGEMVAGWAIDTDHAELPVVLEIWAGANLLGTSLACAHRADLEDAGKGNGQCAFFFALPPGTNATSLRVRRAGDGASLPLAAVCRDRLRAAA